MPSRENLIGLGLLVVAAVVLVGAALRDPAVPFLSARSGADWILLDQEPFLGVHTEGLTVHRFRKEVFGRGPDAVGIEIRALRLAELLVDGKVVAATRAPGEWRKTVRVRGGLQGRRRIEVRVANIGGPPALWLRIPALGVGTGADWEASADGVAWSGARPASSPMRAGISADFPSLRGLARAAPMLAAASAVGLWCALSLARAPSPAGLRWALLGAWALLSAVSLARLPPHIGFDAQAHIDYVRFLIENGRVPNALDGWQMFQPPLYYLVSLPFYAAGRFFGGPDAAHRMMRAVSLVCGGLQIELCFRSARAMFPGRDDLQRVGTVVAGLIPMSLYMSQGAGNEPLAGVFCAGAVALVLSREPGRPRTQFQLGVLLGLGLLTKVSALLLVFPLLWLLAVRLRSAAPAAALRVLGTAALIAGWYYAWTAWRLGSPFVGGWDPARGILWWQEPGYRVAAHFLPGPEMLLRPVYAATHGFWESLYSTMWLDGMLSSVMIASAAPPWNADLMTAGAWLALVPSGLLAWGLVRSMWGGPELAFCGLASATYLAAAAWLYLRVPIYSTAKGTYLLGLLPVLAVLAARGSEPVLRRPRARALLTTALTCWGAASFGAYFIVR